MEKNFEIIYEELYNNNYKIFQEAKKAKNTRIIITIIICVFINLLFYFLKMNQSLLVACIVISVLVSFVIIAKETAEYRRKFKESIVAELIKQYNPDLRYIPESGISEHEYRASNFDWSYDRYHSEDSIRGMIDGKIKYEMAEVVTKEIRRTTNNEGEVKKEEVETFRGIFGVAQIEGNVDHEILISTNSLFAKNSGKRVEMDSAEFETNYDCFSSDRLTAMKIFTADLLEKFVSLQESRLNRILLRIKNNTIYFRISCGAIFEPPQIKDALDKKTIKKYFDAVSIPIELIEKINDNIKRI